MRAEHAVGDHPLVEQSRVRQHARRHRGVDGGLELEEQHEVEPAVVAEPDAPHEMAVALLEIFAGQVGGQRGQRVEVEGCAPVAGGEAVEHVADHTGREKSSL